MGKLDGTRVALLEGRMTAEMAALVQRHGGEPYSVPAVREAPLTAGEQVATFVTALSAASIRIVVFLTGAGVRALVREAEQLGRLSELLDALRKAAIVCRGPKPLSALARQGISATVTAPEPYTTPELLEAMRVLDCSGVGVGLVHYGERDGAFAEALRARGARLEELCLYEWQLPEDLEPLQTLVANLIDGRVDAIAFTSQVQVQHLFRVAADLGRTDALTDALNRRTVVASLAPTCAGALRTLGVNPHVVPEHSKMGHLIVSLADYLEQHPRPRHG